ncbi:MAG TPA: MiaB/RimO family radical SAM methylthiotransferase, partial [Candidatus Eisenbacteria bacterium]|nr:MiaB/RimO family radical SAM methylthiotransferase [Candidatus Eisenbacteria bacterium]
TCSVRGHAEERAVGRLNDLSRHEGATIVACGCMAQRLGEGLFGLVPGLGIVAGTDSYKRLFSMISEARNGKKRAVDTRVDGKTTYALAGGITKGVSRYISITRGCENYCTYCIVPYLRGAVRSRDPGGITREIETMVKGGVEEVTLLGQNVMAYSHGGLDFPGLVRRVIEKTGVRRLRFLTTHPRDLVPDIFRIMAEDERVCPHLHLPFQSGSDRILRLMKRGYSRAEYIEKLALARDILPGLAVTTDIIVGFPSESERDFEETLSLVEEGMFDAAFTFKYSPREGTAAAEMDDDVQPSVKKERLARLNGVVGAVRRSILEKQLGTAAEILLDDVVKKGEDHFMKGRSPHFRNVLIAGGGRRIGDFVTVRLRELRNFTYLADEI